MSDDLNLKTMATMSSILGGLFAGCYVLTYLQAPPETKPRPRVLNFLPLRMPDPTTSPSKYEFELFCAKYSVVWMLIFGSIVVFEVYESFTGPYDYILCCGALSLPNLLAPLILKSHTPHPTASYSTKATIYLAVYSFIGNYFYTHYFYAVLKASYTFEGVR